MGITKLVDRLLNKVTGVWDGPTVPFDERSTIVSLFPPDRFPPDPRCVDVELQRWAGVHHIVEHTCRDRNGAPCASGRECWTRTRRESLRSYEVAS